MTMLSTGFESLNLSIGGLLKGRVNTLLCDTPYARTYFIWSVVSSCLKKGGLVYYIDLDTMFTAFLEQEARPTFPLDDLVVFNPDRGEIQDVLSQICSVRLHGPDLVVFDSVTVFYHLFEARVGFGEINRMLGVCLSLLQSFASRMNTAVLVSSLTRAKKLKAPGRSLWSPSYPGGRVLTKRSELILSLKSGLGYIDVRVVKHPTPSIQGIVCRLPLSEA